jgi:hypothetical protein
MFNISGYSYLKNVIGISPVLGINGLVELHSLFGGYGG